MSHFTVVTEDAALTERLHAKMMSGELIQLEGVSFMPIEQIIENCTKLTLSAKSVEYVSVPAGTGRTLADCHPSVGVTCEALHKSGQWVRVTVLDRMAGSPSCACRDENDRLWWATEFRPIRTSEQIAAEERGRTIDAMLKIAEGPHNGSARKVHVSRPQIAALYDAGYRKFEIVDGEA